MPISRRTLSTRPSLPYAMASASTAAVNALLLSLPCSPIDGDERAASNVAARSWRSTRIAASNSACCAWNSTMIRIEAGESAPGTFGASTIAAIGDVSMSSLTSAATEELVVAAAAVARISAGDEDMAQSQA